MTDRDAGQSAPTVLVAHPSGEMYGSDRQCLETVRGLLEAGWRVVVAVPPGPLGDAAAAAGAQVHDVQAPVLRKALLSPRGLGRLAGLTAASLPRLLRLLRAVRPDVVYVSTLTAPLWVVAARAVRAPVLVHVHEAEDAAAPVRAALAAPLLLADRVVVNSGAALQVLRRSLPGATRRARVLHNGMPGPERPVPARQELHGPVRLVLVGRLSPRKGSDVAVAATAELRRLGVPARLDLVGSVFPGYEWYEDELRRQVTDLGLDGEVVLRGLASSPWPAMQGADVVLVPSRVEPFGNTAVEAMLAERPVVASATQGLVEVVRDGVDGVLVPPDDPAALALAVAALVAGWPQARARAVAARAEAERRFSPTGYRQQIAAEAAALVRRPRRRAR